MTKSTRFVVIGTGWRAQTVVGELLRRPRFRLVGAADPDPTRLERFRGVFPGDYPVFDRHEALLREDGADLAVITSPDYCHEEQAVAAFDAGLDVFLEKPIAITVEGGERVLAARDRADRLLLIGFVLRYSPIFERARKLVANGSIGRPTTAWVLHSVASGGPWYFHDWHSTFANTGGLLLQKGSHDFDLINWFADGRAQRVVAIGDRDVFGGDRDNGLRCRDCPDQERCPEFMDGDYAVCAFRREIDVLDNHLVLVEYDNGFRASYQECHYTPDDNREFIFIGTEGKLALDMARDRIVLHRRPRGTEPQVFENVMNGADGHGGGDVGICDELEACLDSREAPRAGGEEGLEAIRIGLAAHESIRSGAPVRIG